MPRLHTSPKCFAIFLLYIYMDYVKATTMYISYFFEQQKINSANLPDTSNIEKKSMFSHK